ncbi:MAG: hypothetical protein JOZ24_07500 [Candidatus Eremiobacteraeota bacterium]|nr:hypothetical protein [Candidatus Eremiobacteraeota bacterium]
MILQEVGPLEWDDTAVFDAPTPAERGREKQLAVASLLFTAFGLFILWWGRDRASLMLGLFSAGFGPALFTSYAGLSGTGMLVAWILAETLLFASGFALYAMAETIALESVLPPWLCRALEALRGFVALSLVAGLVAVIGRVALPIFQSRPAPPPLPAIDAWSNTFLEAGVRFALPIVLLTLAWLFARGAEERLKSLVILLTVLLAESGVALSLTYEIPAGKVQFDALWFTLLAIPVGFMITIPIYHVVDVRVVISRIFVIVSMTAILGLFISGSEVGLERALTSRMSPSEQGTTGKGGTGARTEPPERFPLQFAVAFLIVLSFGTFHRFLDRSVEKVIFRRRDRAVADLHRFATKDAEAYLKRDELLVQAVTMARQSLGACGAAFYKYSPIGYVRTHQAGATAWKETIDLDDPAFVAMRGDGERVRLEELKLQSALGTAGVAFRLAIRGHVAGAMVIGPRINDGDGPYESQELEALCEFSRAVADALFSLGAEDTLEFLRAIAERRLSGDAAVERAGVLLTNRGARLGSAVVSPEISSPAGGRSSVIPMRSRPPS